MNSFFRVVTSMPLATAVMWFMMQYLIPFQVHVYTFLTLKKENIQRSNVTFFAKNTLYNYVMNCQ